MEYRQLEYFIAAAEYLNFSNAADAIHISQPALSKQIIALENEYNVQLFHRHGRTISLTAVGEQLLPMAKKAASQMTEILMFMQDSHKPDSPVKILALCVEEQVLRVGVIRKLYIKADARLKNTYPLVETFITTSRLSEIDLKNFFNNYKVGIFSVHDLSLLSELNSTVLFQCPLALHVSSQAPIEHTLEGIAAYMQNHILFQVETNPYMRKHMSMLFSMLNISPKEVFETKSSVVESRVCKGEGYTILPEVSLIMQPGSDFVKIPLPDEFPPLYFVLVWDKEHSMADFFCKELIECFRTERIESC